MQWRNYANSEVDWLGTIYVSEHTGGGSQPHQWQSPETEKSIEPGGDRVDGGDFQLPLAFHTRLSVSSSFSG